MRCRSPARKGGFERPVDAASGNEASEPMSNDTQPREIKVLLVEDSPSVAVQIKSFLAGAPKLRFLMEHRMDLASSVEWIALGKGFDVILLDLGLPDSDGLNTFLKIHERAPDTPTVVFTGVNDEDLAFEALRQGAQDYLIKGQVDGPLLVRAIRYAIERKLAEESLRESEEKHRTLLEAMPDIVYKIDSEGRFKFLNPGIGELGYAPDELIGEHFSKIIHPEDISEVSRFSVLPSLEGKITGDDGSPKLVDERRTATRMTKDLILRLIPKGWKQEDDTSCVFGSLTSYGEVSATGHYPMNKRTQLKKFAGTVGIIKNITQRKLAEEENAALQDQLQQSQKMEAIGRLAGGVAHDMNNVLGAIMGSASVLAVESDPRDPHIEDIENILMACRKGRDLTRDLLGFARKGKYVKESISLNDVAVEAKALLTRTIPRTIQVALDLDNDIDFIEGDRSQIHHALMNVCINAADSMQDTGTLTISTCTTYLGEAHCTSMGGLPGKYVELSVSDTGVGMDEKTLHKVFEPFFTTKPKGEGTGLGLSMVYGVIKNHGGTVKIESKLGVGTLVTLYLPAVEDAGSVKAEDPKSQVGIHPDLGAILLVDDEEIIRCSAQRLLKKLGYKVLLVENGRRALEVYKRKKQDIFIVLLDLIMPEMDGLQTFRELKEIDPDVKVILFSGYSKDDKVDNLLEAGAVGFIQKPFDLSGLAVALRKAIKRFRPSKDPGSVIPRLTLKPMD
jgi:two-component system, cell cycle sensor histidine kinase and response regulator CckA